VIEKAVGKIQSATETTHHRDPKTLATIANTVARRKLAKKKGERANENAGASSNSVTITTSASQSVETIPQPLARTRSIRIPKPHHQRDIIIG